MIDTSSFLTVDKLLATENRVLKFFNKMQRDAMVISAHDERHVASRGTGKSEGLDARRILQCVWAMPGSTGALISPSYAKAWGNTLPAICHALAEWGYIQGVHYYVGRKAPASAGFKKPKREPLRDAWGNCIHFWNGTILVILSFANGMSANSMSLDWTIGPEAKFLDYSKIKEEVNPANRGNNQDFGYSEFHHSTFYSSDMPTSKKGRWLLDEREKMNLAHINYIRNLFREVKKYESLPDRNQYVHHHITKLRNDLNLARRFQKPVLPQPGKKREYTVYYGEYDIFDNLEVVGEDYIWQMYRESPPLIFRTAFLNERLLRVQNGFYSALNDEIHFYVPDDPTGADFVDFNSKSKPSESCLTDYDLQMYEPIHIAFDANAAICSCTIGQRVDGQMKTLRSFFVKTPSKLPELVDLVCKYYALKPNHEVIFYFDHTFTWTTATSDDSYADTIEKKFTEHGWNITPVFIGQQPPYEFRHQNIDKAMKGTPGLLFPLFNLYNNEYLKIAMEQAGIRIGKNGFEKDKTAEAIPDSPNNPDEEKTHITDAWDTLFIGMNFYYTEPYQGDGGVIFLGVR